MYITELRLQNFKNHLQTYYQYSPHINCFVGGNGVGKTNLLDAIHYLSVGKTFLLQTDNANISQGQEHFGIYATIRTEEKIDKLQIIHQLNQRKKISKNEKTYSKISQHIGYLPSVMISPYDQNLISDTPEHRRKFIDGLISQTDPYYLHCLLQYQKTLQQRNALLKSFQKKQWFDASTLEIYRPPLLQNGNYIYQKRKEFISRISPIVEEYYTKLSGNQENISIEYKSDLEEDFSEILSNNIEKDKIIGYTTKGIHKDDLILKMKGELIKKLGSQGQQKTFLIALKLSQINLIKQTTHKNPIVLLDDIFDKLDTNRVSQLITLVTEEEFGQIFLTDTHLERIKQLTEQIKLPHKIYSL